METDEDADNNKQAIKQRIELKGNSWSKEESQLLLRLYNKSAHDVGPNHTYRSKLHLWNEIARRLNKTYQTARSTVQCIGHYKTLQRKNSHGSNNHDAFKLNVSPNDISTSEEDGEMHEPAGIADIIRSTLLEIHELKEEAKERRHRERMALLEKFLQQGSASVKQTAQPELASIENRSEEEELKPTVLVVQQQQQHHQKPPLENDNQAMRARLLEMQRKKMEDRERKQRVASLEAAKQSRLTVRDFK